MSKQKYYVVWKGRNTGIFTSWQACADQVTGFNGALYKSFSDQQQAEEAFRGAYEDFKGKTGFAYTPELPEIIAKPIEDSYCVDASCIGYPGPVEYKCVHTTTREAVFHQGPFENGTNNVGEFLALVHALALLKKTGNDKPVYSDSETAIAWVRNKKSKSALPRDDKNAKLFELLDRAEDWLAHNECTTQILKWDTNAWGEIPADYGRK